MSLILVAILMIGGVVGAIAIAAAVPVLIGLVAFDVSEARKTTPARSKDTRLRIGIERNVARAFVVAGGVFWSVTVFAGQLSSGSFSVGPALVASFLPLVACLATLAIGWYYERAAAVLLVLASFVTIAWGVIYQFEIGVWMIVGVFLIGPALTAAVLFWLARRDQEAFELALQTDPEFALAVAGEGTR